MARKRSSLLPIIALASAWLIADPAAAAIWSVEADCDDGDWTVEVELDGAGPVDASCTDGSRTSLEIDTGAVEESDGRITATSANGTRCEALTGGEPRFKLKCSEKAELSDGVELEEELEVELELEETDEEDCEDEDENEERDD